MTYFDFAATTPLDKEALEKMLPYFSENFGNPDSNHRFGRRAMAGVDGARDTVAKILKVKPSEIYFTSGGSEANSWAIKSVLSAYSSKGKHLIVSEAEHHSVINCAKQLEKEGFEVTYLPVNSLGEVEEEALERAVREDTVLVCIMTANNEVGTFNNIPSLSKIAKKYGAIFFTDAVQACPYLKLYTEYADITSISAHKFYGPKGVGALYIKSGVKISPLINGGEQERGFRGGTTATPLLVGMAHALKKVSVNNRADNEYIASLRDYFESELLRRIEGVRINGNRANRTPCCSNVTFFGVEGRSLLMKLDLNGFAVSLGSACASGSIGASHVLIAMGLSEREALSSVRFSFGKLNTKQEIDELLDILVELVMELRNN